MEQPKEVDMDTTMYNGVPIKKVYSSYTEAQKRANKKWRAKNKEKFQKYQLTYSRTYYEQNKEKIRVRNLERYYEKKERLAKTKELV
tara:strand:- start:791 stop:1051 length:261 start_codon:yes stop_codon:yes gene_type:complete